jgi:hypothetical protein
MRTVERSSYHYQSRRPGQAGARSPVQHPRRGCGAHARARLRRAGHAEDDPGGPGQRVHLPRTRPLDLPQWRHAGVGSAALRVSRPGKPTDNAFIEAFNGRLRSECLNQRWFMSLADAREKLEAWRRYYNEDRPHGAIGYIPPIMRTNLGGDTGPPSNGSPESPAPGGPKMGLASWYRCLIGIPG